MARRQIGPAPQQIKAMLDTGAAVTCVEDWTPFALGLQSIGTGEICTASSGSQAIACKRFSIAPVHYLHQGRADAVLPINEIKHWLLGNAAQQGELEGPRRRLLEARAELAELEVQEMLGNLVARSEAINALRRMSGLVVSVLEGLADEMAGLVPQEHQDAVRKRYAERVTLLRESLADQMSQEEVATGGEAA